MPALPSTRLGDPQGYYARLGLQPAATQPQIIAAFRARARILHPDVPRTGNADAFVGLKRAYDVLSHPDQRAEYDRRAAAAVTQENLPLYKDEADMAEAMRVSARMPRFSDLPVLVWLGMGALLALATFEAVTHLYGQKPASEVSIRPNAPTVEALPPNAERAVLYGPTPVHLAGEPNFYVAASGSPAVLWRLDTKRRMLVGIAQLPPFSTLHGIRRLPHNNLLEVMVTNGMTGYVAFDHVVEGDQTAARRAYCGYNAGPVPQDGEILEKHRAGAAVLTVENRSVQPAVLKLRDTTGGVALAVFVSPYARVTLTGLPDGTFQPEFATGELWSRACNGFTTGMRAGRLKPLVNLPGSPTLVIAPDGEGTRFTDITEQAFEKN